LDQGFIADDDVLEEFKSYLSPQFDLKKKLYELKKRIKKYESAELENSNDIIKQEEAVSILKGHCEGVEAELLNHSQFIQEKKDKVNDKRSFSINDRRIAYIMKVIKSEDFDAFNIPYGGKKKIKNICLNEQQLFTDSTFDKAWKVAKKTGLIELENEEDYKKQYS